MIFFEKDFSKQYSRPNPLGLGVNFGNDYNHFFYGPIKKSSKKSSYTAGSLLMAARIKV